MENLLRSGNAGFAGDAAAGGNPAADDPAEAGFGAKYCAYDPRSGSAADAAP
jgi:hypothetical protein